MGNLQNSEMRHVASNGENVEVTAEYKEWITDIKLRIRQSQIKAAVKINTELLKFYWYLGNGIVEKQKHAHWGDGFLKRLSKDLMTDFPDIKGFELRNLRRIKQWFLTYNQLDTIRAQAVPELQDMFFSIPWGHHILIMQRCKNIDEALFYIQQTLENNWSRGVLDWQIDSNLYERKGSKISNFSKTLPDVQGDLANQIIKDPYNFDFLTISENYKEKDLQRCLEDNIYRFLLELGKGFSFVGRQVKLEVGGDDFYCDLLFYHIPLKRYVVIELKTCKFEPEFVSKINFYCNAVNHLIKGSDDNDTIGLLICKERNDIVAEWTIENAPVPIGISKYEIQNFMKGTLTADS